VSGACIVLHICAHSINLNKIRSAINQQAEITNAKSKDGWTRLHWAAYAAHSIIVTEHSCLGSKSWFLFYFLTLFLTTYVHNYTCWENIGTVILSENITLLYSFYYLIYSWKLYSRSYLPLLEIFWTDRVTVQSKMWIVVFCVMMPRNLIGCYQSFGGTYRLHLQNDENVGNHLQACTASWPRWPQSTFQPPWKYQICYSKAEWGGKNTGRLRL
jgi:hypothetical protein